MSVTARALNTIFFREQNETTLNGQVSLAVAVSRSTRLQLVASYFHVLDPVCSGLVLTFDDFLLVAFGVHYDWEVD